MSEAQEFRNELAFEIQQVKIDLAMLKKEIEEFKNTMQTLGTAAQAASTSMNTYTVNVANGNTWRFTSDAILSPNTIRQLNGWAQGTQPLRQYSIARCSKCGAVEHRDDIKSCLWNAAWKQMRKRL